MTAIDPTLPYRSEHLSPFLPWAAEDRRLPQTRDEADDALVIQLMQSPKAIVDRIMDPTRAQATVLASVGVITGAGALAAVIMLSAWDDPQRSLALDAFMVSAGLLGALAASIAPIWGLAVLRTARMPITQLTAILTTSVAAASLLLVAMSAAPAVLWRIDGVWAGPLALVGAFLVAAVGCAVRFRSQLMLVALHSQAEGASTQPSGADRSRIQAFARSAMMVLAFTNALAGWAWLALG